MYELISKANLRTPAFVSDKAKDLLEKLLKRNPDERLGAGTEDEMAIRKHPFFADIDFDKLYRKEIEPEFKPRLNGVLDSSNFDSEFTSEAVVDSVVVSSPRDPSVKSGKEEFAGFTYAGGQKDVDADDDDDD